MTLGKLILIIGIAALVLTLIGQLFFKKVKNWPMSYLQNFAGALFIFSGWVKAIDPLGTAYKMEQYFAEFESTFDGTWFSFIAPMFPWLSNYAVAFSVFMIVLEIALGVMLLVGAMRKFTAWVFFIIVAFFTFLTGFTYLTGYVPDGVNFFQFGQWGPYVETNMKVTDCGCFGDFIKLKPKTSFLKDVFLLIPAILFIIGYKQKHQLFSAGMRMVLTGLTIAGVTLYCFSNFSWDLPHTDFRPFKEGVNIAERKALEEEAAGNVEILAYKMTNKSTKEVIELPFDQYMKEFKKYPKEEWDLEQIQTTPTVEHTKISEFEVSDEAGDDVTEDILSEPGYSFMIVAYKLYGKEGKDLQLVTDTLYQTDTIRVSPDSFYLEKVVMATDKRQIEVASYNWDKKYTQPWTDIVNPIMASAEKDGFKTYAITAYSDYSRIDDFRHATQSAYPFYTADDILLKTIVRSNPGLVLMKNGLIIKKWHFKKLPSYDDIKAKYIQAGN